MKHHGEPTRVDVRVANRRNRLLTAGSFPFRPFSRPSNASDRTGLCAINSPRERGQTTTTLAPAIAQPYRSPYGLFPDTSRHVAHVPGVRATSIPHRMAPMLSHVPKHEARAVSLSLGVGVLLT